MNRPAFLDDKVLTIQDSADVLGLSAERVLGLLFEDKESLLLDWRDPSDDRLTWAEFTTIALFQRCKATVFEYTILVGNDLYFAASRGAVLDRVTHTRNWGDQVLLSRLRSWKVYFEADDDGWAVRYYTGGRHTWPQVRCDGTVETDPTVSE